MEYGYILTWVHRLDSDLTKINEENILHHHLSATNRSKRRAARTALPLAGDAASSPLAGTQRKGRSRAPRAGSGPGNAASFRPVAADWERAMKAVVCEAFGGPEVLAVREVPDPPPPGPGEIQVRLRARGVQYVDVLMLAGKYQFRPEPPFIPGNEGAGEVVAVGPDVTRFRTGDLVISRHRLGAFAELANARAEECEALPAALGLEAAAGFRSAYGTAYHALLQRGRLKPGEWVLIHGAAGGIGIPAIQLAKLFGATVIATAGSGVDIVYDPVNGPSFEESLRCLRWGGRILILGFVGGTPALARTNYLLIKGIEAVGVRIGGLHEFAPETAAANMRTLLRLAGEGKLVPRIWRRFPLAEAPAALAALIARQVIGKAVLVS